MHLKLERLQNNEILVEDGTGVGRFRIGYITLGLPDFIFTTFSSFIARLAPHLGLLFYTVFGRSTASKKQTPIPNLSIVWTCCWIQRDALCRSMSPNFNVPNINVLHTNGSLLQP
jgi:hypothetical protein